MATGRMDFAFDLADGDRGAARRGDEPPMRILAIADLGGSRRADFAARAPLAVDVDNFEQVFARIAPRRVLKFEDPGGAAETLTFDFATPDDFHPDRLIRGGAFDALRELRAELTLPGGAARVAAALGLPAAAPAAARENDADAIARLLGRPPSPAAPRSAAESIVADLARELSGPHPDAGEGAETAALAAEIDRRMAQRMATLLHHPGFQALEASWRGVQRLAGGLEPGERLQLQLLDANRLELQFDVMDHAADLSRSRLCHLLCGEDTRPPEGAPWSLIVCDFAFGPELEDVLMLAGLAALGAVAGAPVLAAARLDALGCSAPEDLSRPEHWRPLAAEDAARWTKLRRSASANWVGLALPRILGRLPYGARSDPVESFPFEEMEGAPRHGELLWTNPAWSLALLAGQGFQEEGWPPELDRRLDIEGLPALAFRDADGEPRQQPCAEVAMGEAAAEAILARGIMPLLSYRNRDAARLLRWQSIAEPAARLGRF
jgi:type VI secretion system protein ImpC